MLYGSRMVRFSFGVYVHMPSPTFSSAWPASFAGAVKRISVSSRPRLQDIMDVERSQDGRLTFIVNST